MEITSLRALVNNLSSFLELSSRQNIESEPIHKYYRKIEEVLKLLKPVLEAIIGNGNGFNPDEKLLKSYTVLGQSVEDLHELFESWQLLKSKVYFVMQVESLMVKVRTSSLEILELLKLTNQSISPVMTGANAGISCVMRRIRGKEDVQSRSNIGSVGNLEAYLKTLQIHKKVRDSIRSPLTWMQKPTQMTKEKPVDP